MLSISLTKTLSRSLFHALEHHAFQKMSHVIGGVALEAASGVNTNTNNRGTASEAIREGSDQGFGRAGNGAMMGKDRDKPQRANGVVQHRCP